VFADKIWDNNEYKQNFAPLTSEIKVPALAITGTKDFAIGISHYRS
jgi:hypothetical protein